LEDCGFSGVSCLPRRLVLFIASCTALLVSALSQTSTVIPANEAPAHVGEYATVEGVVVKVFTSNKGNTFLNFGAAYPNQTFTGWIPPGFASEQIARAI
jgi:hypothetical protein